MSVFFEIGTLDQEAVNAFHFEHKLVLVDWLIFGRPHRAAKTSYGKSFCHSLRYSIFTGRYSVLNRRLLMFVLSDC